MYEHTGFGSRPGVGEVGVEAERPQGYVEQPKQWVVMMGPTFVRVALRRYRRVDLPPSGQMLDTETVTLVSSRGGESESADK